MNYQSDRDEIKALMKGEYEKVKQYLDILPPSVLEANYNGKVMKAQLTAYCGVYRKDKSMFDKGVRNYNKYSIMMLDGMRERDRIIGFIGEADDGDMNRYRNDEAFRQAGIQIKTNYDMLNTTIPNRLREIRYWD
jgi:hypothetical protein